MTDRICVIAEAGVNHNGSLERALQLVDAAADAGADAVKFQTFKADALVSRAAPKAQYQIANTGTSESQYEMIQRLELDDKAHDTLIRRCRERGIEFLSTPFDHDSLAMLLTRFHLARIKVSSGDLTNAPLLLAIARAGAPAILSTGMGTLEEVEAALGVLAFGYLNNSQPPSIAAFSSAFHDEAGKAALRNKVTVLHCTTEYPAPLDEVNLRAMATLREAFGLPVGYSDHTQGITVPIAAAALGAVMLEKHLTLDRGLPGPDHKASLEPGEFAQMVKGVREVEAALGSAAKQPAPSELKNIPVARKSLVAGRAILRGEALTEDNMAVKRPGDGISPMHLWEHLGMPATRDYQPDEKIQP